MHIYKMLLQAERRAWAENNERRALILGRWKARAYLMYAVECVYL